MGGAPPLQSLLPPVMTTSATTSIRPRQETSRLDIQTRAPVLIRRTESCGPEPGESPADTTSPLDTASVSSAPSTGVMGLVQDTFPVVALKAWMIPSGSLAEPHWLPPTTTRPFPTAIESLMSCDVSLVLRRHSKRPVAASYFAT